MHGLCHVLLLFGGVDGPVVVVCGHLYTAHLCRSHTNFTRYGHHRECTAWSGGPSVVVDALQLGLRGHLGME